MSVLAHLVRISSVRNREQIALVTSMSVLARLASWHRESAEVSETLHSQEELR